MQEITKIVITGGPCGGKSSAMNHIKKAFEPLGYRVLILHETATDLITGGIAPWTCGSGYEYQLCQMKIQAVKEAAVLEAAKTMPDEKILIVCDRGMADNRAYMTEEEYLKGLEAVGYNEVTARDGYDAVFHMTTTAKGEERAYSLSNNAARTEDIPNAVRLDDRIISAWTGHPHFRVIASRELFHTKAQRLIEEIKGFMGIPEPLEIERKYLIEYPDLALLDSLPNCRRTDIEQVYLLSKGGMRRVRKRGEKGDYLYFYTEKRDIDGMSRMETERRITEEEYNALLKEADPARRPVIKNRYCITHEGQYFELDVYPFWKDKAILEIELLSEEDKVTLPPFIKLIKEVTGDKSYSNSALAKTVK